MNKALNGGEVQNGKMPIWQSKIVLGITVALVAGWATDVTLKLRHLEDVQVRLFTSEVAFRKDVARLQEQYKELVDEQRNIKRLIQTKQP